MRVWTIKEYTNVETSPFSLYKSSSLGHAFTSLRIHFLQKWTPGGEGWIVRQKRRQSSSDVLTANLAAHQESNLATRPPNPTGACVLQVPLSITETSFFLCVCVCVWHRAWGQNNNVRKRYTNKWRKKKHGQWNIKKKKMKARVFFFNQPFLQPAKRCEY